MLMVFLAIIDTPEERDVFTGLYQKYEGKIYSYAYRILNDELDAEAVTLETFEAIAENLSAINTKDEDGTRFYILTAAKNRAINLLRAKKRVASLDDFPDFADKVGPHERLEQSDEIDRVKSVIRSLPDDLRRVLLLSLGCDLSAREIAAVTEKPLSTVYRLLAAAKSTFAKKLSEGETV